MSHGSLPRPSGGSQEALDEQIVFLCEKLYPTNSPPGQHESSEHRLTSIREASRQRWIRFLGRVIAADLSKRQARKQSHD